MTNNDNRKKWEDENNRAKSFFDAFIRILDKVKRALLNIPDEFPVDLSEVKQLGSAGGSTGATIVEYTDVDGNTVKFIRKTTSSKISAEHLENECRADTFYRSLGVNVPEIHLYKDKNGRLVKLSRFVEGLTPIDKWWDAKDKKGDQAALDEMRRKIREHFAVDVLVGNWDAIGDWDKNIMIDQNGNPIRIDNGCSFGFHGSGRRKSIANWGKVTKDQNGKEKVNAFFDDLWTMTGVNGKGNGSRIGNNVSNSSLMTYFGDYDVLQIANEVHDLIRTPAAKAQMDAALQKLTDSDAKIIEKRLEEARQLSNRGNRYVKIEDKSTFPRETALDVLDYSYIMSKEGLREVLASQTTPPTNSFSPSKAGWFHYNGHSPQVVGGKSYDTFGYYLADKIGAEGYDFIQKANQDQGWDSYNTVAIERKLCVLKNAGLDCLNDTKYPTADSFLDSVEKNGYYIGTGTWRRDAFRDNINDIRNNRSNEFQSHSKAVLIHNAALQLLLENTPMFGSDPATGTIIVGRTEEAKKVFRKRCKSGERVTMLAGVCESQGQIKEVAVYGDTLTLTRVPYSRVHGVWFLQRYPYSNGQKYRVSKSDTQFLKASENEFNTDNHGLPTIKDGKAVDGRELQTMWHLLTTWEKNHYTDSVLGKLNQ